MRTFALVLKLNLIFALCNAAFADDKNQVKGLTLPPSITVNETDVVKKVVPRFDDASKVKAVKWIVISSGKTEPDYKVEGTAANSVLKVTVPAQGDAVLIYAYAMYPDYVTDPASTILDWGTGSGGTSSPSPPPTPSQPEPIPVQPTQPMPTAPVANQPTSDVSFASSKGIHVILVCDGSNAEMAQMKAAKAAFASVVEVAGTNNKFWIYDVRVPADVTTLQQIKLASKLTDPQGRVNVKLPVVAVIDGASKRLIGIQPIPLTGNVQNDAAAILTSAAGMVKR